MWLKQSDWGANFSALSRHLNEQWILTLPFSLTWKDHDHIKNLQLLKKEPLTNKWKTLKYGHSIRRSFCMHYKILKWSIVHGPKGKFRPILTLKLEKPCPQELVYMHYTIHTYLHKFCEPFLFDSIVWHPWTIIVYGLKEKFGKIWKKITSNISKTGEATPIKIGAHALHNHSYLHEFFESIWFNSIFDTHGL